MENQLELFDETAKWWVKTQEVLPSVTAARTAFSDEVYKGGALSVKIKRLIALGVALHAECTRCIIGQTNRAVEAGASKEEVLEAVLVANAMGGSTTGAESWRVVKVLEELGKW